MRRHRHGATRPLLTYAAVAVLNRRKMLAPAAASLRRVVRTMLRPRAPARLRKVSAKESGTSAVVTARTNSKNVSKNQRGRMLKRDVCGRRARSLAAAA